MKKIIVENKLNDFVFTILNVIDLKISFLQAHAIFFFLQKSIPGVYLNKFAFNKPYFDFSIFDFKPQKYVPKDELLEESLFFLLNSEKIILNIKGKAYNKKNFKFFVVNPLNKIDVSSFLDQKTRKYIKNLANKICDKDFKNLCFSIYKQYPEMGICSVFNSKI